MKQSVFIFLFLFSLFFFYSCASTAKKLEKENEPEPPALFDDWQYKGFGTEYPLWCEAVVLEKGNSALEEFFPQIKDSESNVETCVTCGNDLDMTLHLAMELDKDKNESDLLAKSWVKINPIYQEYDYVYTVIRIYLIQPLTTEDSL